MTAEAVVYPKQLRQQDCTKLSNKLHGALGTRRIWPLLLDTKDSKSARQHHLKRLIHNYLGTEADLIREYEKPLEAPIPLIRDFGYGGCQPNPDMDWTHRSP